MVEKACSTLDADPPSALRTFNVQYILWDKARMPQWDLTRLHVNLQLVAKDAGWELLRISPTVLPLTANRLSLRHTLMCSRLTIICCPIAKSVDTPQ